MLLKEIEIRAIRWCRLAVCVKTHPVLAPGLCWASVKSKSKQTAGWTPTSMHDPQQLRVIKAPITLLQKYYYLKVSLFLSVSVDSWVNLLSVAYTSWFFYRAKVMFYMSFYSGNLSVTAVWLSWGFLEGSHFQTKKTLVKWHFNSVHFWIHYFTDVLEEIRAACNLLIINHLIFNLKILTKQWKCSVVWKSPK